MILDICGNVDVLKAFRIVKLIILILRIAVPIILIISMMSDILQAVKDGETTEMLKRNKNKIIATVLVFLVPFFVNTILMVVKGGIIYENCIQLATQEGIQQAYSDQGKILVDQAYSSLSVADYNAALTFVKKMKNHPDKTTLLARLDKLHEYVEILNNISKLQIKYDRDLYKETKSRIDKISDETIKKKLEDKFSEIWHYDKTDTSVDNNGTYHVNGYNGLKYYLYSQCEGKWKGITVGRGENATTFCAVGCGLTTSTVIVSAYNPNFTPDKMMSYGDDRYHNKVVEKLTDGNFKCTRYANGEITTDKIIDALQAGDAVSIMVYGHSKGGSSKFTGSQHYMALIDYYEDEIFVGNAYNPSYSHGKYGWYPASEVLTSVKLTVICEPQKF